MRRTFRHAQARIVFAALISGVSLCASLAHAGDLADADDLLAKAPEIDQISGWYLRGDIGYVANETPGWSSLRFDGGNQQLDDSWTLGGGAGVRVNDWLRVDATVDYRFQAGYAVRGLAADFTAATLMANAYVDLVTWNGITPYIGAGLGAGYAGFEDASFNGMPLGNAHGWGFAWGLMGGLAVELSPNWSIDLGYRYLTLTDIHPGRELPHFDQEAHEVRVGFRYMFD